MEFFFEAIDGDVMVLRVDGGLDSSNAREFGDRVQALVDAGHTKLILDATKLQYISSLGVAVLLRLIDAFKVLEVILVMTNGGPGLSTEILSLRIFRTAQEFQELGYAAAMSNYLLIMLMLLTIAMFAYNSFTARRTARLRAAAQEDA